MENNINPINKGINNPTAEALPTSQPKPPTTTSSTPMNNNINQEAKDAQALKSIRNDNATAKSITNRYVLQVSIRRKPGLVGLPGADPAERVYKIGSSLDVRTKSNLKGISGDLETKYMPNIVGISSNAPEFKRTIDEYWSSLSVLVPIDEVYMKEHEKGLVLKVVVTTKTSEVYQRLQLATEVEERMKVINSGIEKGAIDLHDECINDWMLLNYCLKYTKIANDIKDVNKSPKIDFYIYSKDAAVKAAQTLIDLKAEAFKLYQSLTNDEKKIDAVLLMYEVNPTEYEDVIDKLIEVDKLYSRNRETYLKFIDFVKDVRWEDKYLISMASKSGKLNNPANSTVYYYNQVLLGRTLDEAVVTLNDGSTEMNQIKMTLQREIEAL